MDRKLEDWSVRPKVIEDAKMPPPAFRATRRQERAARRAL